MIKKNKIKAIIYNLLIPGAGDLYVEKNKVTILFLILGIIFNILNILILIKMKQEIVHYNDLSEGLYERATGNRESFFIELQIIFGVLLIVPRIFFSFEVINRIKKFNNKIKDLPPELIIPKVTNKNISSSSPTNITHFTQRSNSIDKYISRTFISEVNKAYNLKINGIYSEEEFVGRKIDILNNLKNNGISQSIEDFLVDIIPLKMDGILSTEEIDEIKRYINK
ncbi:MAG: hypothetical protein ACOYN6_00285 [Ignavibacteria bacterium]